ncbi:MAG: hypothetical protein Ct9H90mP4_13070 [Gammaproteobacteria bacterium]|nr:MAG: hypothetical protein Ct9H90mP4_13070 [Gammaproteobacteria bacterium]
MLYSNIGKSTIQQGAQSLFKRSKSEATRSLKEDNDSLTTFVFPAPKKIMSPFWHSSFVKSSSIIFSSINLSIGGLKTFFARR